VHAGGRADQDGQQQPQTGGDSGKGRRGHGRIHAGNVSVMIT
jgi:hypothetical protein